MSFLEKVYELITKGILLPKLHSLSINNRYQIITDYSQALEMPEKGDISYLVCEFDNSKSGNYSWNNIGENEVRKIFKILYDENKMDKFYSVVDAINIFSRIERSIGLEYIDIVDAVEYDISALLACGVVHPKGNEFYRDMYAVYRDGGWPCGWEDKNGKIIAFFDLEK